MNKKDLDDAHYYLREAFSDLQRAKYLLSKSEVESFPWYEKTINRMQTSIKRLMDDIVNIFQTY